MHTTKVTISLVKSSNNNTGRTKKKGIPECTDPLCETVEMARVGTPAGIQ